MNFADLEPPMKVFSMKLGAYRTHLHCIIGFIIPQKFSPQNGHFLLISESFLPRKVPAIRYIHVRTHVYTCVHVLAIIYTPFFLVSPRKPLPVIIFYESN